MYLNEATLLNNVRVRYSKDKIYVSMATPFVSGNIYTTYQYIPLPHTTCGTFQWQKTKPILELSILFPNYVYMLLPPYYYHIKQPI